jgi:hypothetical protein
MMLARLNVAELAISPEVSVGTDMAQGAQAVTGRSQ